MIRLITGLAVFLVSPAFAQQNVEIETVKVREGLYMLVGQGGNLGLCIGDDAPFLIDDQYAPLTDKILAAVKALDEKPVKFLVNTHFHGDHTGGNENFGKRGALIFAHDNVRARLSTTQTAPLSGQETPPLPKEALPVVTFAESVTFHWNKGEIHVFHVERAHTDGDCVIHFKKKNAFHVGDILFNGLYPFIDADHGGSIHGVIAACDRILDMADEDTLFIPGHGELADVDAFLEYRDMLGSVRDSIQALMDAGKSVDEIVAAKPTKGFDADWGKGFLPPDRWVRIVCQGMKRK